MALDCAEALKDRIGVVPNLELSVDDRRELIQRAEESVVDPKPAQELPNSLDWIKFRAVRRKKPPVSEFVTSRAG
jgi:hypothetical protein